MEAEPPTTLSGIPPQCQAVIVVANPLAAVQTSTGRHEN